MRHTPLPPDAYKTGGNGAIGNTKVPSGGKFGIVTIQKIIYNSKITLRRDHGGDAGQHKGKESTIDHPLVCYLPWLDISEHARERMRARCIRETQIALAYRYGRKIYLGETVLCAVSWRKRIFPLNIATHHWHGGLRA
ncbi:MAG: hypothetical protein Fur0018_00190 [Anaerolineales bacterium]